MKDYTETEIALMNEEQRHDNLRKIMNRLTVGSKEYTKYSYKLLDCRQKIKRLKEIINHDTPKHF